ncbi:MAG: L-seryl-tRNA(Sec) selenium transferase [Planctomycetaceae bacterium]|nr:L-seryl-tRNA(Sec) selenium transferase [Planctomycetaceae bacterium]
MPQHSFRCLPAVDLVVRDPGLQAIAGLLPRQQVLGWIRAGIDECRQQIVAGREFTNEAAVSYVVKHTLDASHFEMGRRQQSVINATGILLHTNLGRACLAEAAVERMNAAVAYSNVEMNMWTGRRNKRGERVCELLCELTGAEDAVIVNNCAAATMLTLQTVAAGREVVISRGQLVEIGGGYRLPEVFAASGAVMREVGTTNRTYVHDYEGVITDRTAALIRVHRSNFYQGGFVTEPDTAELVQLGAAHNLPVIDDIGSGCMHSLESLGLAEPTIPESVATGAELTLFSGDKLFGGPQAGIIVGKKERIAQLRSSPMARALRIDKVTLAALEATVEIHLSGAAREHLPLLRMMYESVDSIRARCEQVVAGLKCDDRTSVEIVECVSEIGGGSVPGSQVTSCGLAVTAPDPVRFARDLRTADSPVQAVIRDGAVRLDLRTVLPGELQPLVESLNAALQAAQSSGMTS